MTRIIRLLSPLLALAFIVACNDTETQKKGKGRGHKYGYHSETTSTEISDATMPPPPTDNVTTTSTIGPSDTTTTTHAEVKSTSTEATAQPKKDYPYGTPVPGKAGFVTSPHAPYSGYVDVRGYPPGTEVKDPYTGKTFLVP